MIYKRFRSVLTLPFYVVPASCLPSSWYVALLLFIVYLISGFFAFLTNSIIHAIPSLGALVLLISVPFSERLPMYLFYIATIVAFSGLLLWHKDYWSSIPFSDQSSRR